MAPSLRLSLRCFNLQPIQLPELKSILAVQNLVTTIPKQPKPLHFKAFNRWIETYCCKHSLDSESKLDEGDFNAFMKEAGNYLLKLEEEAFQDCRKIGLMMDEELSSPKTDAFAEAVKVKLSRHMCKQDATTFGLLDKDKDGFVCTEDVKLFLQVTAHGNGAHWLKRQFQLYDDDGDEMVNEAESKSILNSMVATQKAVMTEIFANHVEHMPKKCSKHFTKSMVEVDFKTNIPEKMRCVFHFANKLDKECRSCNWEMFLDSQKSEFLELHNLLAIYAKGFYDERFTFYQRKQDNQKLRYKGLGLAAAIVLGDYLAAVI
ncbi:putative guanylate cyclase activating protein [Plasmopara halstedii]